MDVRGDFAGIDTIDPATIAPEPSPPQSGARALVLAMLEQGIHDAQSRNVRLRAHARAWWGSRREDYGSARFCCATLGIDYAKMMGALWAVREVGDDATAA